MSPYSEKIASSNMATVHIKFVNFFVKEREEGQNFICNMNL